MLWWPVQAGSGAVGGGRGGVAEAEGGDGTVGPVAVGFGDVGAHDRGGAPAAVAHDGQFVDSGGVGLAKPRRRLCPDQVPGRSAAARVLMT